MGTASWPPFWMTWAPWNQWLGQQGRSRTGYIPIKQNPVPDGEDRPCKPLWLYGFSMQTLRVNSLYVPFKMFLEDFSERSLAGEWPMRERALWCLGLQLGWALWPLKSLLHILTLSYINQIPAKSESSYQSWSSASFCNKPGFSEPNQVFDEATLPQLVRKTVESQRTKPQTSRKTQTPVVQNRVFLPLIGFRQTFLLWILAI